MFQSFFRKKFNKFLDGISGGQISIFENGAEQVYGDAQGEFSCTVRIHSDSVYRRLALGGGIGAAESHIAGEWSCDCLTSLMRIFSRNMLHADTANRGIARWQDRIQRWAHRLRRNTVKQARQNIHEHYDLGNDFFASFLDPTMNYSSGIFQRPDDSMMSASINKMWRICKKLDLQPTDHVLEIGTGWGGLAVFAAQNFGCKVTTTTISEEQFLFARQRVANAGLQDRIKVLKSDYRDLAGRYDKIVSVEMIEAVGCEYFDVFFAKCNELLSSDGLMLLQTIVIGDQRYEAHTKNVDFIKKHIFPGGCLPANAALMKHISRSTEFQLLNHEDIGLDYARTLFRWRHAYESAQNYLREIGMTDERFHRMWNYYLCYCEAGFRERQISNVHLLFGAKSHRAEVQPDSWVLDRNLLHQLERKWLEFEPCDESPARPTASKATDLNSDQAWEVTA